MGKMLFPIGPMELQKIGWQIYPLSRFFIYGTLLGLLGTLILYLCSNKPGILSAAFFSFIILFLLKIFVREQGDWILKEFAFFSWTYFGLILTFVLFTYFLNRLSQKNLKQVMVIIIGLIFWASFLFPWLYNPGTIFDPHHRYLILTSVGFSILVTTAIFQEKTLGKKNSLLKYLLFLFLIVIQIISVDRYLSHQLNGRNGKLNDLIFNRIKNEIPIIPTDGVSVFYFENFDPWVYENLLRASFGYHIQLIYDSKFDEQILPFSVSNYSDLEKVFHDESFTLRLGYTYKPDMDHVYAFGWKDGEIVNITDDTRNRLLSK
jgi:hypothetical protein